jgi:iron-sulfur cluster repair protein YtfE (RIC family)
MSANHPKDTMQNLVEDAKGATIAELVLDYPQLLPVLDTLGLDTCCGGHLTPGQAAVEHGLDPEAVQGTVERAIEREGEAEA